MSVRFSPGACSPPALHPPAPYMLRPVRTQAHAHGHVHTDTHRQHTQAYMRGSRPWAVQRTHTCILTQTCMYKITICICTLVHLRRHIIAHMYTDHVNFICTWLLAGTHTCPCTCVYTHRLSLAYVCAHGFRHAHIPRPICTPLYIQRIYRHETARVYTDGIHSHACTFAYRTFNDLKACT